MFLSNKRLFAYSPSTAPSGAISTDPVQGNIWLGTEEGVEVWSGVTGSMMGKVLVPDCEEEEGQANNEPGEKEKKRSGKRD